MQNFEAKIGGAWAYNRGGPITEALQYSYTNPRHVTIQFDYHNNAHTYTEGQVY